ncbi:flagellar biosynthesis protein FlhF [Pseudodesulfovibrio sediminis]|uniref:Flagellar biosynthesis protein FlhF n=1 Tax=Pseudodesulfovibrio sediminis TaxID=2810563 RepID=A0ABN6EMU6_9BACT|nr:flagellar biosynthesis protein FlhF [Pseudodesulfovibrio sediminis]BCS87402.1 flagellar biosynthesis protein FlhF [Pseudodesulfovibrio sediminis]
MRMKTFRAATSTAAFAKVKAELGNDAVILSNKTITEDGCKGCEIVAAVDNQPVMSAPPNTKENVVDAALKESVGWQREWSQIKGQIMQLMKPQMDMDRLSPKQKIALEYLEREDVDEKVLTKIYCDLREDPKGSIMTTLDPMVKATPFTPRNWPNTFHAFAGPGGAGKTSTLVRLALKIKKESPRTRICLATADGGRGKGRLVLKHYAELSGLAFREIITRDDVALLQQEASQFDMILIDLPGLSGKTNLTEWTQLYGLQNLPELSIHLVLNPYYSTAQFERFVEKYKSEQLASVIWTKLDETCTFGLLLNMAFASGLPISALSYGTGLKNSIATAAEDSIWRLLFMRTLPNGDIQP